MREIARDRLPEAENSLLVSCPKCQQRFRLLLESGESVILPELTKAEVSQKYLAEQAVNQQDLKQDLNELNSAKTETTSEKFAEKKFAKEEFSAEATEDYLAKDREKAEKLGIAENLEESEEDPRLIAKQAYDTESQRGTLLKLKATLNPWELAPNPNGWLEAFVNTVKQILFKPERFFTNLQANQSNRMLSFFFIIGLLSVLAQIIWIEVTRNFLLASQDAQIQELIASLPPATNIILTLTVQILLLFCQLYLVSSLLFLSFRFLLYQAVQFNHILQITAYAFTPMLLGIIPFIGSTIGLFWSFGLLWYGCSKSLNLNHKQIFIGFLPLFLLILFFVSQIISSLPANI